MSKDFHEAFPEDQLKLPSDRSTGLVLAVAAAVAAYLGRGQALLLWPALAASATLFALCAKSPARLRPLNIAWMRLAHLMSRIVSPVVMLVLFLVMIVPFGLAMQLVRDPLRRRRSPGASTYWIDRDAQPSGAPVSDMRNQF
jgi:hypothetical protein